MNIPNVNFKSFLVPAASMLFAFCVSPVSAQNPPDPYEQDDSPFTAQRVPVDQFTDFIHSAQTHSLHHADDEDWISFESTPCGVENSYVHIFSPDNNPLFQPMVELYSIDRLTNPAELPVAVYSSRCIPAQNYDSSIVFPASTQGFWRIRNCPQLNLRPNTSIQYTIEQTYTESGTCHQSTFVQGRVLDEATGNAVKGGVFVKTDQGFITFSHPDTGQFRVALDFGAARLNSSVDEEISLTLSVISNDLAGTLRVSVSTGQSVEDVDILVSETGHIFSGNFESGNSGKRRQNLP